MSVGREELARRIKVAREACQLTQDDVARHLGLSRPAVTEIEKGRRSVSSLELQKIAYLLGRSIQDFFEEEFAGEDALAALFRAHPEVTESEEVVDALRRCVVLGREARNLERLLGIDREGRGVTTYGLAKPTRKWDAIQQGVQIAGQERRRLGRETEPIPNVARLLEAEGILTAIIDLPGDVSGVTLGDPRSGELLVVVNKSHGIERRRFSYAHEYAHVVLDRTRLGILSRGADRNQLMEVRANSFAAAFLMPEEGVAQFMASLGRVVVRRSDAYVFDEERAVEAEYRPEAGSREIQVADVVRVAHHYGVSRRMAIYRLANLGYLDKPAMQALLESEDQEKGLRVAKALGLRRWDDESEREVFREGFLNKALEAYRREEISRGKLRQIARLVETGDEDLEELLESCGLAEDPGRRAAAST